MVHVIPRGSKINFMDKGVLQLLQYLGYFQDTYFGVPVGTFGLEENKLEGDQDDSMEKAEMARVEMKKSIENESNESVSKE